MGTAVSKSLIGFFPVLPSGQSDTCPSCSILHLISGAANHGALKRGRYVTSLVSWLNASLCSRRSPLESIILHRLHSHIYSGHLPTFTRLPVMPAFDNANPINSSHCSSHGVDAHDRGFVRRAALTFQVGVQ
jgi:hypothetical protein